MIIAVLVTIAVLGALFPVVCYLFYSFVFLYPERVRVDPDSVPDKDFYKGFRDRMLGVIGQMQSLASEQAVITADDGTELKGRLYCGNPGAPLIIFCHGYHGTYQRDGYGSFRVARDNGYHILLIEQRAHGRSGGRVITFGVMESRDCRRWAEYAADRFGADTPVFLSGVSMGGASVLMAGKLGLPGNVKGIIADCSYTTAEAEIKNTIRSMHYPVGICFFFIKTGAKIFGKFRLEDGNALEAVRTIGVPVLFVHGTKDSVVPLEMCEELCCACGSPAQKVLIEGSEHAVNAVTDYDTYRRAVSGFIETCLKGNHNV